MGEPAQQLLWEFADLASSGGQVDRPVFLANAERELSVALCRGNALLFQACYGNLAKATGRVWSPGVERPRAESD